MKKITLLMLFSVIGLIACVHTNPRLEPGADRVILVTHLPECGCRKIDCISSTVINGVTMSYSSRAQLAQRAVNELRSQAAQEGANVVLITKNQAIYRVWPGFRKIDTYTLAGTAYQCGGYALDRLEPVSICQVRLTEIYNKSKCN